MLRQMKIILFDFIKKNILLIFIVGIAIPAAAADKKISTDYFEITVPEELVKIGYSIKVENILMDTKTGDIIYLEKINIQLYLNAEPVEKITDSALAIRLIPQNKDKDGYVTLNKNDYIFAEALLLTDDKKELTVINSKNYIFNLKKSGQYTLYYNDGDNDFTNYHKTNFNKGTMYFGPVKSAGNYTLEIKGKKNNYYQKIDKYMNENEIFSWKFRKSGIVSDVYNWKLINNNNNDNTLQGGFGLCLE